MYVLHECRFQTEVVPWSSPTHGAPLSQRCQTFCRECYPSRSFKVTRIGQRTAPLFAALLPSCSPPPRACMHLILRWRSGKEFAFHPRAGDLILFPPWQVHQVCARVAHSLLDATCTCARSLCLSVSLSVLGHYLSTYHAHNITGQGIEFCQCWRRRWATPDCMGIQRDGRTVPKAQQPAGVAKTQESWQWARSDHSRHLQHCIGCRSPH